MPTLSLTVLQAKALKNGRNKVRIAVAHNSQTRYIVTDVVIDSPKEFKNGQIVRRDDAAYLNMRLRAKMNEVQQSIDAVPYPEGLTCPELIETIHEAKKRVSHTLRTAFDEMMAYAADVKESTRENYVRTFNSIVKFIPATTKVASLTPLMIRKYIKQRTDIAAPTLRLHICILSKIINYCQENKYTDFTVSPTKKCMKFKMPVRQNWLTPDQVRYIRDFPSKKKYFKKYRDLFMLTYYLGGINAIDLLKIDFNVMMDHIKYVRTKTNRCVKVNPFVEFDVPEEAKVIIRRWKRPDGHLAFFNEGRYDASQLTRSIQIVRRAVGIECLTLYSARKSFAQQAFQLGISESVIDYILGHALNGGNKSTIFAYIKVTPAMATEAIKKVIEFINGNNNFD